LFIMSFNYTWYFLEKWKLYIVQISERRYIGFKSFGGSMSQID
jgi:hypothetical protein